MLSSSDNSDDDDDDDDNNGDNDDNDNDDDNDNNNDDNSDKMSEPGEAFVNWAAPSQHTIEAAHTIVGLQLRQDSENNSNNTNQLTN